MRQPIVLCADSFSLRFPEVLGLPDEQLSSQAWLKVFSDGEEARGYVAEHPETPEVWVLGSDDMEAINLAAAIKADCAQGPDAGTGAVYLVTEEAGDVPYRAQAADLDGILSPARFVCRYAEEKIGWAKRCQVRVTLIPGAKVLEDRRSRDVAEELPVGATAQVPVTSAPKVAAPVDEHVAFERVSETAATVEEKMVPAAAQVVPVVQTEHQSEAETRAARTAIRRAALFPVISATGGAGKSTVAALGALSAARLGRKVLLVDADFQFGDMAAMLADSDGVGKRRPTFDEVLDGTFDMEVLAAETREGQVAVLGALASPERAEACEERFPAVLAEALRFFDVVVVNTGASFGEVQATLIDRATRVLYVLDQRPFGIRVASGVLNLCSRCGIATGAFTFLVNRCHRGGLYTGADVAGALGYAATELPDGGLEAEELTAAGRTSDLLVACNPLAREMQTVMDGLLGAGESASAPRSRGRRRGLRMKSLFSGRADKGELCPF